jgi:hypothetical protein
VRSEERYPDGVAGQFTTAHGSLCASPLGCEPMRPMSRTEGWFPVLLVAALVRAAPVAAQVHDSPSTPLVIHSVGIAIWNDTTPTFSDSNSCKGLLAAWPPTGRGARALRVMLEPVKHRCDGIAAGRKPRDSTEVAVDPSDFLSRVFVAAAHIPHRRERGIHACPWTGTTPPPGAALDLRVTYTAITPDSGRVNVWRTCTVPGVPSRYSAAALYYVRRTPSGWVIRTRVARAT